jgi:DNA-binding transcriptional MocR family regulator
MKVSGILNSGGCSNHFSSSLIKPILNSLDFSDHLIKIREEYQERRNTLLEVLRQLPDQFLVSSPKGGFFIWITDKTKKLDTDQLLKEISCKDDPDYKITFTPGNSFSANKSHSHCMRISFGMYKGDDLRLGAERLVKILKESIAL